jgi:hypothetical protein
MRNLLRDLGLILKGVVGAGAVYVVPGVTPYHLILLLVIATLLKDFADHFYTRVESLLGTLKAGTVSKAEASPLGDKVWTAPASPANQARAVAVMACALFAMALAGCSTPGAVTASPTPASATGNLTGNFQPTATQTSANLLQFAETAQNVIQSVNTGAEILAPDVSLAASVAKLVVHGQQETDILNKIVSVSSAVSADGASAGLPAPVVQAQVSATNTPQAAAAIVAQVTAASPSN